MIRLFFCIFFSLSFAEAASINSYSGSLGGSEATFQLAWHENDAVRGQCELADGGVWQLEGSNYAEGRLQLFAFQHGSRIGVIQLSKNSSSGVITWSGDLLLADNTKYPVKFSRASARSAPSAEAMVPQQSLAPAQSMPNRGNPATQRVLSFEEAKMAADQGDAFAQAIAALHYQLGWNIAKNPELAAKYAAASANAGEPMGQFRLGALMREGVGVPKDEERGLSLQAASFNGLYNAQDPYSMTAAGIMIFQGKVVGQNISQGERRRDAAALYKRAADLGFAPAQFNYAMCAESGHGIAQNQSAANEFLWKAMLREYPLALQHMGFQPGSGAAVTKYLEKSTAKSAPTEVINAPAVKAVIQRPPDEDAVACAVSSSGDLLAVINSSIGVWELPSGRLLNEFPAPQDKIIFAFFRGKDLVVATEDGSGRSILVFLNAKTGVRSRSDTSIPKDVRPVAFCPSTDSVLCLSRKTTERYSTGGEPESIALFSVGSEILKQLPHPPFSNGATMTHALFDNSGNIFLLNISPEPPYYGVSEICVLSQDGTILKQLSRGQSDFIEYSARALALPVELLSGIPNDFGGVIGSVNQEEAGDCDLDKLSFFRSFFEWNCPQPAVVVKLRKPVSVWCRDIAVKDNQVDISGNTQTQYKYVAADRSKPGFLAWGVEGFANSERNNLPYIFDLTTLQRHPVHLSADETLLNARKWNAREWVCSLGEYAGTSGNPQLKVHRGIVSDTGSTLSSVFSGSATPYEITESTMFIEEQAVRDTRSLVECSTAGEQTDNSFWGELSPRDNSSGTPDFSAFSNDEKAKYEARKWSDGKISHDRTLLALWNSDSEITEEERFASSAKLFTPTGDPRVWKTTPENDEKILGIYPYRNGNVVITTKSVSLLNKNNNSVEGIWRLGDSDVHKGIYQPPLEMGDVDDASGLIYVVGATGSIHVLKITDDQRIVPLIRIAHNTRGLPVLFEPDGTYMSAASNYDGIHFSDGGRTYPLEQFDLRLNRPDIVLELLGAPAEAVSIAKQLREKRLKRMGVTEEMLKPDFHVPELEIVGGAPATTDANEINVAIKANDSKYPLERLKVFVNNVPVNGRDGESLRDQNTQTLERTIPIKLAAGRNKIQVSVLNNAGAESLYANAEVNCTAKRPKPTLYAVALGVSDYANPEWNLKYAAKDARDVLDRLKSKAGDSYGEVKELLLTDKKVTKESLVHIKDFLKDATIDDTVLMFVAGHGLLDSNYDYYFGTTDIDFNNPAEKGIAFEEFDDLLAALPCLKKSLLIDTCHAGELDEEEKTLLASADASGAAALPTAKGVAMRSIGTRGMNVKAIEGARGASEWYDRLQGLFVDLRRGSGSTILSSSAGAEYALESSEQQNGLFTYAVLEALDGKKEADTDKDGSIEMSELGEYVKKRVSELTNNKQTPNTRRVNLEGDFTVAKTR